MGTAAVERSWVGAAFAAVAGATGYLIAQLLAIDDGWAEAAVMIVCIALIHFALVSLYRTLRA